MSKQIAGTIRRVKHDANYTVLNTEVARRDSLSWAAKGLHTYLMQLPDDWKINIEDLSNRSKDGKTATRTAMRELLEAGYANRKRAHDENGRFEGYDYEVFECLTLNSTVVRKTDDGKTDDGLSVNGKPNTNKYLNKLSINEVSINNDINEGQKLKIEIWNAETEFEQVGTINPNNSKQDAPGGGASAQQYSDTDEHLLKERDPKPKKDKKKEVEPPRGMSMADFIKPIERLNFELQRHLNMPGHTFCRLNADGNLKKLKDLYDKTKCQPDEAAEVVAYIVGKWVGGKCQDNLTPDTLFRASNYTKYRGWYEMYKAAPVKPQQQHQPRRERLRMDEPDFSRHGEKQIF